MIESIENRRLMSVSLDSASKLLTITGKDDIQSPDSIVVSMDNGKLKVSDNGVVKLFDPAKVNKIKVLARKGADVVDIKTAVTKPTEIDTGTGGAGNGDTVYGGGGKDTIHVRSDSFVVQSRGGHDVINIHNGIGNVDCGSGDDSVFIKASDDRTIVGGDGIDTIDYFALTTGWVIRNGESGPYSFLPNDPVNPWVDSPGGDTLASFENFTGTQGNDYIHGNNARNILRGAGGNDQIWGYDGNDEIYGGKGNDKLYGGLGLNALFGGDGDDQVFAKYGSKDYISGGLGFDSAEHDPIDILEPIEAVPAYY